MNKTKYDYTYRLNLDIYQLETLQKYIQKIENIQEEDLITLNEIK